MTDDESTLPNLTANYKLWLEFEGEYVFGPGAFEILRSIKTEGTITEGAKALGMSYRYAWGVIRGIEKKLGVKLLKSYRGGTVGGGHTEVTQYALRLMEHFSRINDSFGKVIERDERD